MAHQLVKVTPFQGAKWDYGFVTPNYDATLGHELVTAAVPTKPLVIGSNSNKPLRVGKKLAAGSKSTFCDISKVDDALNAGWKRRKATGNKKFRGGPRSKKVCIKVHANLYLGWLMRLSTYNRIGDAGRQAAGILDVDAAIPPDELVFGAARVMLPVAVNGKPAGTLLGVKDFEGQIETSDPEKPAKTKKKPD